MNGRIESDGQRRQILQSQLYLENRPCGFRPPIKIKDMMISNVKGKLTSIGGTLSLYSRRMSITFGVQASVAIQARSETRANRNGWQSALAWCSCGSNLGAQITPAF